MIHWFTSLMGTFNTAKMTDLRNLGSDEPSLEELDAAPFPLLLLAGEKDAMLHPATVRLAGELLPGPGGDRAIASHYFFFFFFFFFFLPCYMAREA